MTAGEYSDYHIVGIYDTREAADYHAEHFGHDCYGEREEVEEYELNPHAEIIAAGLKPYTVEMGRDGTTYDVERGGVCRNGSECLHLRGQASMSFTDNLALPVCARLHMYAKDEKHAVKIANERRARLIADNVWLADMPRNAYGDAFLSLRGEG